VNLTNTDKVELVRKYSIGKEQAAIVEKFLDLLFTHNQQTNLTGLDKRERAWGELIAPALGFNLHAKAAETIADIGSGNGIPGIIISILNQHSKITLIESRRNRIAFLREVKYQLHLNYEVLPERVEKAAENKFPCVVGFRVAELETFLQLSSAILLDGGIVVQYCPQLPTGDGIKVVDKSGGIWYYQKHADCFITAKKCST